MMSPIFSLYMLMFAYIHTLLYLPFLSAQSTEFSARALDSLLQNHAFRAFPDRPRTGIPYDGNAPSNLSGIGVAALRLRSGGMRKRGFSSYKEFHIPIGVVEQPYVERVVLVYHNLANWSSLYYPLPAGYTYLSPVVGLLAYDATDLTDSITLPELDIRASQKPILVEFSNVKLAPNGSFPVCVFFGLDGSLVFNKLDGNVCSTFKHGHFSIAFLSIASPPPLEPPSGGGGRRKYDREVWVIVGLGGVVVVVVVILLGTLAVCVRRCRRRKKIHRMEQRAEESVWLPMKTIGDLRAPTALETRTRPILENEHVV